MKLIHKYRIWDNELKEYIEDADFLWSLSRSGKLYDSRNDNWNEIHERYQIELFTGFYDKNKKEIYHSDIVKRNSYSPQEIWFENGSYLIGKRNGSDGYFYDYIAKDCEVIGNMNQNPELLK